MGHLVEHEEHDRSERGAGIVEYAILMITAVLIIMGSVQAVGASLIGSLDNSSNEISSIHD